MNYVYAFLLMLLIHRIYRVYVWEDFMIYLDVPGTAADSTDIHVLCLLNIAFAIMYLVQ